MSVLASAEVTQLVTRHILLVTDEGAGGLPAMDSPALVLFGSGSLALICAGSEMGGTVTIERHDGAPTSPQGMEWELASEASFDLPTGNLALSDLEGPLERFPDLGLYAGRWQIRVQVTGRAEAALWRTRFSRRPRPRTTARSSTCRRPRSGPRNGWSSCGDDTFG